MARSSALIPARTSGRTSSAVLMACSAPGRSPDTQRTKPEGVRGDHHRGVQARGPAQPFRFLAIGLRQVEAGLAQMQQPPPEQGAHEIGARLAGCGHRLDGGVELLLGRIDLPGPGQQHTAGRLHDG